jgi:hypothetical protein
MDWTCTRGIGRFLWGLYYAYFLINISPVKMVWAWVFTTSGDKSFGGAVSQCIESAVNLLIGHLSVV